MKKLVVVLVGALLTMVPVVADALNDVQSAPAIGQWTSDYYGAKAAAKDSGLPLLAMWSSPGCAKCNKMKAALNSDMFVAWRQSKSMFFAYNEGDDGVKSELRNSSGNFPYMRLYWPAQGIDVKFTGRSNSMSATGATLQEQLINYLTKLMGGDDVANSGDTAVVIKTEPVITSAQTYYAGVKDDAGELVGALILKAAKGKASGKSKGFSKFSGTYVALNGKTYSIPATNVRAVDWPVTAELAIKNVGTFLMSLNPGSLGGVINGVGTAIPAASVGSLADGEHTIKITETPVVAGGSVFSEALPDQVFTAKGGRLAFPKAANVQYVNGALKINESNNRTNKSGITIKVNKKSGVVKGSFKVYALVDGRFRKFSASIKGVLVDGRGSCVAFIRNMGSCQIVIE